MSMAKTTVALPGIPEAWAALRGTGVGLIVGMLLLGGLFQTLPPPTIIASWSFPSSFTCFGIAGARCAGCRRSRCRWSPSVGYRWRRCGCSRNAWASWRDGNSSSSGSWNCSF